MTGNGEPDYPHLEELTDRADTDVKTEFTDDDDAEIDDLAAALESLDIKLGNRITFTKPADLAKSRGKGSIDTGSFARDIIVLPESKRQVKAPTHGMYARAETGNYFKVADMWLNTAKSSGNSYFNFKPTTPGLKAGGKVFQGTKNEWEIVFSAEAKCGECGAACSSCGRKR